jgi:CHAT domain-containing protein
VTVTNIADLLDEAPVHSGIPVADQVPETPTAPVVTSSTLRPLRLSVTWGNIAQVRADIHSAGHYQGVVPAAAERDLDAAISSARFVIEEHTRRGWLIGALGEVTYFPGSDAGGGNRPVRRVALAGMGRLGTLTESRATQMYASLLGELLGLDCVKRAATVLIGTGAGNLTVPQAARALVAGFASVVSRSGASPACLEEVVVAEIDRLRAEQVRLALDRCARQVPSLVVAPEIGRVDGGQVGVDSAAVFAICGLARLVQDLAKQPAEKRRRQAGSDPVGAVLERVPNDYRSAVRAKLAEISDDYTALAVIIGEPQQAVGESPPVRISVVQDQAGLRWAALTERSTIPERVVGVNPNLVKQLIDRLSAPTVPDAADLPRLLTRFVVPVDFQRHITDQTALVVEVDRDTARLPWEFLTDDAYDNGQTVLPLAVRTPVARQLRTSYAAVAGEDPEGAELRALVIGDPGDPQRGHGLPAARAEAKEVADVLRRHGATVRLFLGTGQTDSDDAEPATQLDVLKELLGRKYHLIHYAGHGTFDPQDPRLTGWLFVDGLLGARELAQLTRAPRLVVANACWSAARPDAGADDRAKQAALTPVLADEFLRVGVVHYVGTSWRVPDELARRFARTFYESLLAPAEGGGARTVGQAVRAAREGLFYARGPDSGITGGREQWSAWAAYQHYGDPQDTLELGGRRFARRTAGEGS